MSLAVWLGKERKSSGCCGKFRFGVGVIPLYLKLGGGGIPENFR